MNKNQTLTTFQMHENITLALNSARAIGCNVVNIGASDIWNGTKHLLLGLLWQVIKIGLLKQINIVAHAELATLLEGDETITDFAKLSPENILIRWVNFHLNETESETRMENFSFDVRNSEVYAYLVEKITPQEKKPFMHSAQAILDAVDLVQRAEMVLQNAEQLNCRVFVRPEDIVSGSQRLNLAFLANLFHGYPALEKIPEVEEIVAEIGETREEKSECLDKCCIKFGLPKWIVKSPINSIKCKCAQNCPPQNHHFNKFKYFFRNLFACWVSFALEDVKTNSKLSNETYFIKYLDV